MKNKELAEIFESMAAMMELLGENPFRINSYHTIARTLGDLSEDIERLSAEDRADEIPGIGESTSAKIKEYFKTGKIARNEELKAQLPAELPELLRLQGLGPKTIAKLWKRAGITSLADLKESLDSRRDKLLEIEGLGQKKLQQIAESLGFVQTTGNRVLLGEAHELASELIGAVEKLKGSSQVTAAGSLRRGRETVGDIDLLCVASKSAAEGIIEQFASLPQVQKVLAKGGTKGSVLLKRKVQADLRVVPKDSYGAALAYFTGSKAHNVHLRERAIKRKLKLNEYGLFKGDRQVAGTDEEGLYKALDLPYIPPELREDHGEIDAAEHGKLPELVELSEIRGDFQMHTDHSDGANTIEEMIQACRDLKYTFLAITDHSKSQRVANGLDEKRLLEYIQEVREAARRHPDMLVLAGCEVDILKDGRLDFDDEVLAKLDFVLASPHAALSMPGPQATRRLIKAIEHPLVHCIAHPTGRLINSRPGMDIDIDAVASAAAEHHVALEINADYRRLDLRDAHVRAALDKGATILLSTDAHTKASLSEMMPYGVATARRGWARAKDIINTWPLEPIRKWLKKGRD